MKLRKITILPFACVLILAVQNVYASPVVLDFEGIGEFASPSQFYNGGTDSLGNSGVNYGVAFSFGQGLMDSTNGGNTVVNSPSGHSVLGLSSFGSFLLLDFAAGFTNEFSFSYSANNAPLTINVYDGLGGSGTLLGSLPILPNHSVVSPAFSFWSQTSLSFSGIAKSLTLSGSRANLAIDDLVLGVTNSVPIPSTLWLMLTGLIGITGRFRIKK